MPMRTTAVIQSADDPVRLLSMVERRVTARLAAGLEAAGSTPEEWRVLSLLSDGRGHPMSELAEYALLAAPTLTKVIDRMVSANLVYRRVDEIDRRRVLAFLSERGRAAHEALAAVVDRHGRELEAAAGREELALLGALLSRIATMLPS